MNENLSPHQLFARELGGDRQATRMAHVVFRWSGFESLKEVREYREAVGCDAFLREIWDVPGLGEKGRERLMGLL